VLVPLELGDTVIRAVVDRDRLLTRLRAFRLLAEMGATGRLTSIHTGS
jgi:hypothetical protein